MRAAAVQAVQPGGPGGAAGAALQPRGGGGGGVQRLAHGAAAGAAEGRVPAPRGVHRHQNCSGHPQRRLPGAAAASPPPPSPPGCTRVRATGLPAAAALRSRATANLNFQKLCPVTIWCMYSGCLYLEKFTLKERLS